jgi:hypothetical protein
MSRWFRYYDDAMDDPKVQRLSGDLFKTWVNLLCLASKSGGKLPSNDDIAFRLRISIQDAQLRTEDLIMAGLIDVTGDVTCDVTCDSGDEKSDAVDTESDTDSDSDKERKKDPPPPKMGATPIQALNAFNAWNETALRCGVPQAAKLTPDRQRKIIARLKDYGPEGWSQALANIEKSSFLTGKNDRGWTVTLDFFVKPEAFGKVHDGTYGNGRHAAHKTAMKPHEIELQREAEEARRMGLI